LLERDISLDETLKASNCSAQLIAVSWRFARQTELGDQARGRWARSYKLADGNFITVRQADKEVWRQASLAGLDGGHPGPRHLKSRGNGFLSFPTSFPMVLQPSAKLASIDVLDHALARCAA
jgi:hypothetical protein